jgi:hypothetical protein
MSGDAIGVGELVGPDVGWAHVQLGSLERYGH